MKHLTILGASLLVLAFASVQGCGGDDTGTGGTGGGSTSTSTSTSSTGGSGGSGGSNNFPPAPTLGMQMDRFGRPAINTALNHAFDGNAATKGPAKDAWNTNGMEAMWVATFAAEVAANLAIIDSLDTNCGNQLLAGPDPVAGRYNGLAGALANDKLFLNTAAMASSAYLAVEANALAVVPNMDGGGRRLAFDVIDVSYSALAAGALQGVGDGIAADADTAGAAFPYLAAPH